MGAVGVEVMPQWHSRFVKVFNAWMFIEFLDQLLRYYGGTKVHLITDNTLHHESPEVRKWLQGNIDLIELHFLPAYSPRLSAVEHVRRETKRDIIEMRGFKFGSLRECGKDVETGNV